jgi:hypothetical protein
MLPGWISGGTKIVALEPPLFYFKFYLNIDATLPFKKKVKEH